MAHNWSSSKVFFIAFSIRWRKAQSRRASKRNAITEKAAERGHCKANLYCFISEDINRSFTTPSNRWMKTKIVNCLSRFQVLWELFSVRSWNCGWICSEQSLFLMNELLQSPRSINSWVVYSKEQRTKNVRPFNVSSQSAVNQSLRHPECSFRSIKKPFSFDSIHNCCFSTTTIDVTRKEVNTNAEHYYVPHEYFNRWWDLRTAGKI